MTTDNNDNGNDSNIMSDDSYASRIKILRAKLHTKMAKMRALAAGMSDVR